MELSQLWLLSKVIFFETENGEVFPIWKTLVKFFCEIRLILVQRNVAS